MLWLRREARGSAATGFTPLVVAAGRRILQSHARQQIGNALQSAELQSAELQSAELQSAELQSAELQSAELQSAALAAFAAFTALATVPAAAPGERAAHAWTAAGETTAITRSARRRAASRKRTAAAALAPDSHGLTAGARLAAVIAVTAAGGYRKG